MQDLVPVQVNGEDYGDERFVIEAKTYFDRYTGQYDWAVPAWEEMGLGRLAGDFPSREAAQAALDAEAEYLPMYGFQPA